jgi:hypothetical protein
LVELGPSHLPPHFFVGGTGDGSGFGDRRGGGGGGGYPLRISFGLMGGKTRVICFDSDAVWSFVSFMFSIYLLIKCKVIVTTSFPLMVPVVSAEEAAAGDSRADYPDGRS